MLLSVVLLLILGGIDGKIVRPNEQFKPVGIHLFATYSLDFISGMIIKITHTESQTDEIEL